MSSIAIQIGICPFVIGLFIANSGILPSAEAVIKLAPVNSIGDLSQHWYRLSPFITCTDRADVSCPDQLGHFWDFRMGSREKRELTLLYSAERTSVSKRAVRLESCQDALLAYGGASADFIGCSINFSRPILLCEKCIEAYLHAREKFTEYAATKDENGKSCDDIVYGSDLIEVVHRANKSIESLWSDSHCKYCFDSYSSIHGTVVYQFSENLMIFIHKHKNLTTCFTDHGVTVNTGSTEMTNLTNSSTVCRECYPYYKDLTDFFLKNYTEDITKTCMDVVDVMNQTRRMWGQYFQCEDRHPSMFLAWTVAVIIFSMTIVFYVGMFFNSSFEYYVIRRQDRLVASQFVAINNQHSQSNPDLSYLPL